MNAERDAPEPQYPSTPRIRTREHSSAIRFGKSHNTPVYSYCGFIRFTFVFVLNGVSSKSKRQYPAGCGVKDKVEFM